MPKNGKLVSMLDDPIENCILDCVEKLRVQNDKMKHEIDKSNRWASIKNLTEWKPYDFYHYFCHHYQEKYKKRYVQSGNIVRAYQKIEAFIKCNNIENVKYKMFIDTAFSRYWNFAIIPVIGNICSSSLYKYITGTGVRKTTTQDLLNLDQRLAEENQEFERYVRDF